MTNEELWKKFETGICNLTPNTQLHFGVHIVEHCNLNCKQCSHYSPLAEEEYIDVNNYKKDCNRLSDLFGGEMSSIKLYGGEPLLHPQIVDIMRITREAFPIGQILLVTNGLLFSSMTDDFWEACKKYNVIIESTCYPIKVDYAGLKKLSESKGVKYIPFDVAHNAQLKVSIGSTRTKQGGLCRSNFINCKINATRCVVLKDGKLYPCPLAAYAPHLKKYFHLDMHLSEKNGVNIYSMKSGGELLKKIARPIPFCQYCDITDKHITSDWGVSKKDRYEWLAFEFTVGDIEYLKAKTPVVYVFGAGRWGSQTVMLLKDEEIGIKNVLVTKKQRGLDDILGVPVVTLDELGEVEPDSICLVALASPVHKSEVYPLLSQMGFGDVVPVFGIE